VVGQGAELKAAAVEMLPTRASVNWGVEWIDCSHAASRPPTLQPGPVFAIWQSTGTTTIEHDAQPFIAPFP